MYHIILTFHHLVIQHLLIHTYGFTCELHGKQTKGKEIRDITEKKNILPIATDSVILSTYYNYLDFKI